ncbi:MAG: DUF1707 domain-containing protein [Gemmatimonadota bacterium]
MEENPADGTPITRRQWVIDALCEAFARDQLEVHELERRLEVANRARTDAELRGLLEGLDLANLDPKAMTPSSVAAGAGWMGSRLPAATTQSRIARVDSSQVPERELSLAFWSGRSRKGSWIPAKRISAIAIQGGIELDFRDARFGPGVTHIHAVAVMGAVEITVPPELHVETSGFAVMGAFEDDAEASGVTPGEGPVLRVTGLACMGAVEVKVRLPGETDRQARERKKRRFRALREQGRAAE